MSESFENGLNITIEVPESYIGEAEAFFSGISTFFLIAGIALVLLKIGLAFIPASIARRKGYSFARYYWFGFFLFASALCVALLREERKAPPVNMGYGYGRGVQTPPPHMGKPQYGTYPPPPPPPPQQPGFGHGGYGMQGQPIRQQGAPAQFRAEQPKEDFRSSYWEKSKDALNENKNETYGIKTENPRQEIPQYNDEIKDIEFKSE